jgi:hypothetical protein
MSLGDTVKDSVSDDPWWKGDRFEQFVLHRFDERFFDLVQRRHSRTTNEKRFIGTGLDPDFIFKYLPTQTLFAVGAKYHSELDCDGMLGCGTPYQLNRYRDFCEQHTMPIYIVLGLGGIAARPKRLFLIPLNDVKYPSLYPSVFEKYERKPNKPFRWVNGKLL